MIQPWRALLAILAALLLAARPAAADPALFAVHGGAAPVFLFGSIHVLRPGADWRTRILDQTFETARQCWFETTIREATLSDLRHLVPVLDVMHPLSPQLDEPDRTRFAEAVEAVLPGALPILDRVKPWFAAMTVIAAQLHETVGSDPVEIVDEILSRRAEAAGKQVGELENLSSLVTLFSAIPYASQLDLLRAVLAQPRSGRAEIDLLEQAWRDGDMDRLREASEGLKTGNPVLHDVVLHRRNALWVEHIDTLLRQDEPALVTVGVLHLVGQGNLRELLQARGYTIERLQ